MIALANKSEKEIGAMDLERFERDRREQCLKMARLQLESARKWHNFGDISDDIEDIRYWAESGGASLADLGTDKEELNLLMQTGYKSEARSCLELTRGMYGCSCLRLYLRGIRNVSWCLFGRLTLSNFGWLLRTVFCLQRRVTCQDYITEVRKFLLKAALSPSDIGSNEAELARLES